MTSLLFIDRMGALGRAGERKPTMRIADRLAPYSVLDPSWHYRDPRSVVIDLDLLAGPSLERTPDGTRWTGEQLVPADYRTVLDLVRAS